MAELMQIDVLIQKTARTLGQLSRVEDKTDQLKEDKKTVSSFRHELYSLNQEEIDYEGGMDFLNNISEKYKND